MPNHSNTSTQKKPGMRERKKEKRNPREQLFSFLDTHWTFAGGTASLLLVLVRVLILLRFPALLLQVVPRLVLWLPVSLLHVLGLRLVRSLHFLPLFVVLLLVQPPDAERKAPTLLFSPFVFMISFLV